MANLPANPTSSPTPLRKILVLRFSSLGDIVMTTAMIRCLRKAYPNAQIDMVVRGDFLDLIKFNPNLNGRWGLARDKGSRVLTELRDKINNEGYDLVYDAHRSLRTRLLMPAIRAKQKVYFDKHYVRRSLALTLKAPLLKDAPRFLERFVQPLEPFGVKYDGLGPELYLDEMTRQRAWGKAGLKPDDRTRVGIIPSAQWPGKRWPLGRFREVVERLISETDHEIVVFGGPEDAFCADLCRDLPAGRVRNTQGKLSIAESAAVIELCDLVIANDTGLMHVADALGVPSVLIFGPTSAELGCLPYHPWTEVLEHQLWCRPCSKNGEAPCLRGKRVCLDKTSTADVFGATVRLLERVGAAENR